MDPELQAKLLAELKYEIDMLYVTTEIVLSPKYKEYPLDSILFEVCLLHFRVVWDFFYASGEDTDFTVRDVLADDQLKTHRPKQPKRLRGIRDYVDVMLAHLSQDRIDADLKNRVPQREDFALIREHTETLFKGFVAALTAGQKAAFKNTLPHKF